MIKQTGKEVVSRELLEVVTFNLPVFVLSLRPLSFIVLAEEAKGKVDNGLDCLRSPLLPLRVLVFNGLTG